MCVMPCFNCYTLVPSLRSFCCLQPDRQINIQTTTLMLRLFACACACPDQIWAGDEQSIAVYPYFSPWRPVQTNVDLFSLWSGLGCARLWHCTCICNWQLPVLPSDALACGVPCCMQLVEWGIAPAFLPQKGNDANVCAKKKVFLWRAGI